MADDESSYLSLFTGGGIVMIGLVVELGIAFVAKLIIAPYLGEVDYGAVTVGITLLSTLSTVVLGGLHIGIPRFLPRFSDTGKQRGVLIAAYGIVIPISVLIGTLLFLLAPRLSVTIFNDNRLVTIIRIFAAAIPLASLVKLAVGTSRGFGETLPKVILEHLSLPIVRFVGIGAVVLAGFGAVGVSWAYFASYLVAAVLGGYYVVRHTPLLERSVGRTSMTRDLFTFSAPLVLSTTMTVVFTDIDLLMLAWLRDLANTGVYNVVYPLAHLIMVGLTAFAFLFMPALSALHSDGAYDEMRRVYQVVTKWVFVATLPVFLVQALFPTLTIKLTFGPIYAQGAPALTVLAVGFFTHALLGPNGETLTAIGRTKTIMWANAATAVANVAINLALIPSLGFYGAAIATAASYAVLNAIYSVALYRATRAHPFTASLLKPGIVGGVAIGAVYLLVTAVFSPTLPVVVLGLLAFVLVYGVGVVRFGVEVEEVAMVMALEDRLGVDFGPAKRVAKWLIEADV